MTNYEKLKSLVEADDKIRVAGFLVDHSLLVLASNGELNELKFLDEEYNRRRVLSGIMTLLKKCKQKALRTGHQTNQRSGAGRVPFREGFLMADKEYNAPPLNTLSVIK